MIIASKLKTFIPCKLEISFGCLLKLVNSLKPGWIDANDENLDVLLDELNKELSITITEYMKKKRRLIDTD